MEEEIQDPILAPYALKDFDVGKTWLQARIKDGRIRSRKVGHALDLFDGRVIYRSLPAKVPPGAIPFDA